MCSSGAALSQTVKQAESTRSYVAGSDTMLPPVAMTQRSFFSRMRSSARRS